MSAVDALWRHDGPVVGNLYASPAFVRLRETCQRLYPSAGSKDAVNFALSHALHGLGYRWSDGAPARFAVSSAIAAARLDRAFRQTEAHLVHLCPLDLGDDVPELRFGPNAIRNFTADELDDLIDPDGLLRKRPDWRFESRRFSRFAWLVVEEVATLPGHPGGRALPGLFVDLRQDFGRIEPHKKRFTAAVERLRDRGVPLTGEAVEAFEVSYGYEEENDLPHVVDGRLATSAGSIDELLTDIIKSTSTSGDASKL